MKYSFLILCKVHWILDTTFLFGGISAKLLVSEARRLYHKELVAEIIEFPKTAVLTSDSVIGDNLAQCFTTNNTVLLHSIGLVFLITEFW